jgi:hypothetical protein
MDLLEKETWAKHQQKIENDKLKNIIKEQRAMLEKTSGSKKRRMDLFAEPHPDFPE